jgi:hypothetical protein
MSVKNAIKTYVKNYYEISYNPDEKQIFLHDEFESNNNYVIDLGKYDRTKITLVWGKIEEITGMQYHHKELQNELSQLFFELIRDKKSKEFLKLLINENLNVNFKFSELLEEFPILLD